jgi:DNA-binding MarR family transcriptional regulator
MNGDRRVRSTPPQMATLLAAARVFAAITAESIAQGGDGVTLPQLRVLMLASQPGPLNASAVAAALDVHLSTASRICDRLVQSGLLHRRDLPEDRRQLELTLTPLGERLLSGVTAHREQVFARILRRMSPDERAMLARSLDSFVTAATEHHEPATLHP